MAKANALGRPRRSPGSFVGMRRLVRILVVGGLLALVFLAVWVGFLPMDSGSDTPAVRVTLLGCTNGATTGERARFIITNGLGHDVLYAQTIEIRGQTGWPIYPGGSRLPHSTFALLETQQSVTLTAAVPTNGAWRVSVVYQDLQTRHGEDRGGIRTAVSDVLHPRQKHQGHWIWSRGVKE